MENYNDICKMKTGPQKKNDEKRAAIAMDIEKIDDALSTPNSATLLRVHRYIDGKYQACISHWNQGTYGFVPDYGFNYDVLDSEAMIHNLEMMKAKLEAFMNDWNVVPSASTPIPAVPDINITNTNSVNFTITFDQVRKNIEDMGALSKKETDEAIEKVNELEAISKEDIPRKSKWEKVKPIIAYAMDKGADLGIALLTLIVQMKLGM